MSLVGVVNGAVNGILKFRPNFKQGHYIYIVSTIIIGSILMYPCKNAAYIDILFTSVASCTQSGLNTFDLNKYKLYQQIVIYLLTTITTPIVMHGSMLFLRLYKFERHFKDIKSTSVLNHKMRKSLSEANVSSSGIEESNGGNQERDPAQVKLSMLQRQQSIDQQNEEAGTEDLKKVNLTVEQQQEIGRNNAIQFAELSHPKNQNNDNQSINSENIELDAVRANNKNPTRSLTKVNSNYLSYQPTIGRNSNFINLTSAQKEELGGVEYRSVKVLIKILICYYIGIHLIALVAYVGWINSQPHQMKLIRDIGVSPNWWGAFIGQSAFNNLGYSLTPNSLGNFSEELYPQIWGVIFIVLGHTGFPVFLRLTIWIIFKCSRAGTQLHESLEFLLDHPRRVFTFLFPSVTTWYLVAILVILNGLDLIFFIVLDLNNEYLDAIPTGYRVMCGIFQAFTTRTAGLSVIDISQVRQAVQVSYMIMMYVSVLPLAISIRKTNVYEEQALGIYRKDTKSLNDYDENNAKSFVSTHIRKQLGFDLWFIAICCFIICIADMHKLEKDPLNFNVFKVLFEIFSGYGTVGLSLGYPDSNSSFSAQFSTISKLIICPVMLRGRHRGLPYSLDRAIMLPSEKLNKHDEVQEENELQEINELSRRTTHQSTVSLSRQHTKSVIRAVAKSGDTFLNI